MSVAGCELLVDDFKLSVRFCPLDNLRSGSSFARVPRVALRLHENGTSDRLHLFFRALVGENDSRAVGNRSGMSDSGKSREKFVQEAVR